MRVVDHCSNRNNGAFLLHTNFLSAWRKQTRLAQDSKGTANHIDSCNIWKKNWSSWPISLSDNVGTRWVALNKCIIFHRDAAILKTFYCTFLRMTMYTLFPRGETAKSQLWSAAAITPPKKHSPPSFFAVFFFFFSSLYQKVSTTGPCGISGLDAS